MSRALVSGQVLRLITGAAERAAAGDDAAHARLNTYLRSLAVSDVGTFAQLLAWALPSEMPVRPIASGGTASPRVVVIYNADNGVPARRGPLSS